MLINAVLWSGLFGVFDLAFAQTWIQTSAPIKNWWSIASSADGNTLIAATADGGQSQIYISTNSGLAWISNTVVPLGDPCVAASADGCRLAIVRSGTHTNGFFISTNTGVSWSQVRDPTNVWWASIATSADGRNLVALGEVPEEIVTSTNFGATWTPQAAVPTLTGQSEWGPAASSADGIRLVVAPVNGGKIYISTNSGINWITNIVYDANWICLASSADGNKLAAATHAGLVYVSTNRGIGWKSKSLTSIQLNALSCSADGKTLVAGAGIFFLWTIFISQPMPARLGLRQARQRIIGIRSPPRRMEASYRPWRMAVASGYRNTR